MKKQGEHITYTFVNPNTDRETEELLRKMIVEKLLAQQAFGHGSADERSGR